MYQIFLSSLSIVVEFAVIGLIIIAIAGIVKNHFIRRNTTEPIDTSKNESLTHLIFVRSNYQQTFSSIQSIVASSHGQHDIVLIDDRKNYTDTFEYRKMVRNGLKNVQYYRPRVVTTYETMIQAAYKKSNKRSVVIVIDSTYLIDVNSHGAIASVLQHTPQNNLLRITPYTPTSSEILGIIITLHEVAKRFIAAAMELVGVKRFTTLRPGYIATSHLLRPANVTIPHRWVLGPKLIRSGSVSITLNGGLTLLWTFAICLAYALLFNAAIESSYVVEDIAALWVSISILFGLIVVLDEFTDTKNKIKVMFCFGLLPIIGVIALLFKPKIFTQF